MNIELSDDEGKLFLLFREHQDKIEILQQTGFFQWHSGSLTYHFNAEGSIGATEFTHMKRIPFDRPAIGLYL